MAFFNVFVAIFLFWLPIEHGFAESLPSCESQVSAETCFKIGQMLIVGFGGLNQDKNGNILWQDPNGTVFNKNSNIAEEIKKQHIGGVILFIQPFRNIITGAFIRDRNIQNLAQVAKLTQALQDYNSQIQKINNLPNLPLLITIDQEGGMIDRFPTELGFSQKTIIPQALGSNEEKVFKNPHLKRKALQQTREYADRMAQELARYHFNLDFAPSLDVNINPLNQIIGIKGRSFSDNSEIVADQAWQFIQAFHAKGIIPVVKHFPGHGSSIGDTHEGLVDVTDTYDKEKELLPYKLLLTKKYDDPILITHVINGQIDQTQCKSGEKTDHKTWCPGTMSSTTLTKLLRQELGFKGIIISDAMDMGAIAKEYPLEVALQKGINGGIDIFIISNNKEDDTKKFINTIAKLVKDGKISEKRIDETYKRIQILKNRIK